jgi:hypothetical protein
MSSIQETHRGIDPEIYLTGLKFRRAANYIPKNDRGAPYFVNLALSVELFIKAIDVTTDFKIQTEIPYLVESKKKVHARVQGHSLLEMFKKLPEDIRRSASINYEHNYGVDLESDLEELGEVFVVWRYPFEWQLRGQVLRFAPALRFRCNRLNWNYARNQGIAKLLPLEFTSAL